MAATVPPFYQKVGPDVWAKNIQIKGKTFQIVVNPDTQQKWMYEQDTFGNGKPLFTITTSYPRGFTEPDNFSFDNRKSALKDAGIDASLLVNTLINNTTWANVQGTQPAPASPTGQTPDAADAGPNSGISTTFDVSGASELTNELSDFGDVNNFSKLKPFLYYPQNIGSSGQDRILITQVEYVPAPIAQTNISVQTATTALGNRESQFTKSLGNVVLPIPNDLSEANGVGWGEDSLSSITAALMSNATQFAGGVASGNVQASLGSLQDAISKVGDPAISDRFKRFLTVNAGASILKLGGININPEAYITRVTGVAINPNLELLFNGPKLRQFAFTFKMTPRSEGEAKNIRSIIKFFKKGMSPRRTTTAEKSIYLGTPNVFQMKFVSGSGGEITSIGKMKTCALVSCGVNYTPDGFYAAYSDSKTGSQPIAVVLTLGFTELTPIFSDDYDVDAEGVGPEPNLNYGVKSNAGG